MTLTGRRKLRPLCAAILIAALSHAGSGWAADTPKRRSSSPTGIALTADMAGMQQPGGGGYAGSAVAAGAPQPQAPAAPYGDGVSAAAGSGAGMVRMQGNTTGAATGSGISTTSTGSGNRGCTSVGGIAGGGC
jgi:hypothetical protein